MIVAGDVIHSAGTRSYFREMLNHMSHMNPQCQIFQFRLDDRPTDKGFVHVDDFPWRLRMAGKASMYKILPRLIYRIYERFVLLFFFLRCLKALDKKDTLIVSGVLGWLHLVPWLLPKNTWWLKLGIIEEEGAGGLRYSVRKWIESKHANFRNRIFVSKPMGEFLEHDYGKTKGLELILPCLVDLARFPAVDDKKVLREQLGLADKFVVAYVGTASHWQCIVETVHVFRKILAKKAHSFFWVFTPDKEAFEKLLSDLPETCWRVEFRPHQELVSVLPAADVACLLRRSELLNRVSSPLKFPEYMACGLPVMIGAEVGQYSETVRQQSLGIIIDPEDSESWDYKIDDLFALLDDKRDIGEQCRSVAESLSWQGYGKKLECIIDVED